MNTRTIVIAVIVVVLLGLGLSWYRGGINNVSNPQQSSSSLPNSSPSPTGTSAMAIPTSSDPLISKLYKESAEEQTNFNTDAADASVMTSDNVELQNLNQSYDETSL